MKILLRLCALSLFLYLPSQAHAWEPKKVKIDAGINCRFNVYVQDDYRNNLAPWYTYWPVEAAYPPPPQPGSGMYFPTWPGAWPPAGDKKNSEAPNGPAPGMSQVPVSNQSAPPIAYWQPPVPTVASQSQPVQPVGYFAQVPGYWYGH